MFAICERLNQVFSHSGLDPIRGAPPDRSLFEPTPRHTLLRAFWKLGVARELEELEAVQSLPFAIQIAIRALLWENLRQSRPRPMHWLCLPGTAPELAVSAPPSFAEGGAITLVLRLPSVPG